LLALFPALASALAALLAAATVHAQASGALDRLDPAPAGDTFVSLPSADVAGKLRFTAAATLSYAHDPLVLRSMPSDATLDWVTDQTLLHLQASLEVWRRLKLDVDVPLLLTEGGVSGSLGTLMASAPGGTHLGDVRIAARAAVLHQDGWVPAAGVTLKVWVPSGSASSFAGAGVVRVEPGVVIGAEYQHLVWGASAGALFQPAEGGAVTGSQVVGGLGVAARFYGVTLGPELAYGLALGDPRAAVFQSSSAANGELWLVGRYRLGPVTFGLAGGPGLGRGPGTPSYRIVGGISGTFDALSPDDASEGAGDGAHTPASTNATSVTPKPPAPVDTDGDGVPDDEDACPNVVGDATPGAYRRGCPPDRDRDDIPDVDDACPDVPGVPSPDPTKNGCPADTDGDGIPDGKDACPNEKGPPNADPKLNGCPTAVRVEGTQIVILQQVNFDTGKATIKKDSDDLLGQVAAAVQQHPDIARVAVDGHTDNIGGDKPNKALSEARALAVVRWLIDHGVDARRLEARGFGQRRPIADNRNEAGRAKNRRVEFLILRRTDKGKDGWLDGPIDDGTPAAPGPKKK
jgi:outer membrane protein OmpA-like peptidoglycan-associated protein